MLIKNYSDIVKVVTSENIDRFLSDFESSLRGIIEMKELFQKANQPFKSMGFHWQDDGKPLIEIEVKELAKQNTNHKN